MNNISFSGFSSTRDYSDSWWVRSFTILEKYQSLFLSTHPHPKEYLWPIDALHNFIRSWEYPYVYQVLLQHGMLRNKRILDLGSGITFFPYAISSRGSEVIAFDSDVISKKGFDAVNASPLFRQNPVSFVQGDATNISEELGLFDAVYCISVIEHIPEFEKVISNIHKILKKTGICILTFDVNLNNNPIGLSPDKYHELRKEISKYFDLVYQERSVPPMEIVSTRKSKYPLKRYSTFSSFYWRILHLIKAKSYLDTYDITSIALVLRKKI